MSGADNNRRTNFMRTVRIKLYQFRELNQVAKVKSIENHRDFLFDIDAERVNPPSTAEVVYSIEANEYYFFEDGDLAHCTTYTGKHEKSGITEFHFHGRDYDITKK